MMAIPMAVLYFTAIYLGIKVMLSVMSKLLIRAARRGFGIPYFRLYALADGIKQVLFTVHEFRVLRQNFPLLPFSSATSSKPDFFWGKSCSLWSSWSSWPLTPPCERPYTTAMRRWGELNPFGSPGGLNPSKTVGLARQGPEYNMG
jgi:hypothetical protein